MSDGTAADRAADPGVPEALPGSLEALRERVGAAAIDRLWIFPPLRRGRRERGLVAVSLFGPDGERRRLVTVAYTAERSGLSLTVEPSFTEEGEAPPDRLPGIMDGVVRRTEDAQGDPREVEIGGSEAALGALLEELEAHGTEGDG